MASQSRPNKCECCGYETWRLGIFEDTYYAYDGPRTKAISVCSVCMATGLPGRISFGATDHMRMDIMRHASRCANVVLDAIEKLKDGIENKDAKE